MIDNKYWSCIYETIVTKERMDRLMSDQDARTNELEAHLRRLLTSEELCTQRYASLYI